MAEAPRNQLPSGYDEDFVNAVEDEVICLICHLTLKEPVLTRCGHRFCKECLDEHFRRQEIRGEPSTCPADREGLDRDRDVFPDKATERKILSFAIKCPSDGCEWTGELRNKQIHLTTCLFKVIPCTNQNCHLTVQRQDLEQHVTVTCQWRILRCEYCREPHPEYQMQVHIGQCSMFPVACPNTCGLSIPREMIPSHTVEDCPLTIISCPYVRMGCETKVRRQAVKSHLKSATEIHLELTCVKLNDTEVTLKETQDKLNDTQESTKNLKKDLETLQRRFEDLEKVKEETWDFPSIFVWKIDSFREILRKAKTGAKTGIYSDPFHTATYGYKIKVSMYPNGLKSGANTHLSVYINVMKGEYDAILPWPFNRKVTFRLIDQQEDPSEREDIAWEFVPLKTSLPECFERPIEQTNMGYGCPRLITHQKLNSRRYLADDTLFVKITIGQPSK